MQKPGPAVFSVAVRQLQFRPFSALRFLLLLAIAYSSVNAQTYRQVMRKSNFRFALERH
jgi:hypothetical protein